MNQVIRNKQQETNMNLNNTSQLVRPAPEELVPSRYALKAGEIHVAAAEVKFWEWPDFSLTAMPPGFPDALRAAAKKFTKEYHNQLRQFDEEHEVAPGVIVRRTGGHTPGHSVVRLASGGEALTFAGDAVFTVGFDHPDWHNGFEHDPEEAAGVRIRLLRELAKTGELLVATHMPFPSVGRVAVDGDAFRFVPVYWDY